ncbi:MAG: hypothetical protein WBF90_30835 [Rivularia sp. (in: cyanobacteria)]
MGNGWSWELGVGSWELGVGQRMELGNGWSWATDGVRSYLQSPMPNAQSPITNA